MVTVRFPNFLLSCRVSARHYLAGLGIKPFTLSCGEKPELFYWRSNAGLEIDLLIDGNQRLFPLETKAIAALLPGHANALNKWRNLAGEETVKGVFVANIDNPMEVSGCRVISWKHAL